MNSNDLTKLILNHGLEALKALSASDISLASLTSANMKEVVLKHGADILLPLANMGCFLSELEEKDLEEIATSENGEELIDALKEYGAVFFSDEDFEQISDSSECLVGVCEIIADNLEA